MIRKLLLATTLFFILNSCTEIVSDSNNGETAYLTDTARVDYKNDNSVIFYDFSTGTTVTRKTSDWDLAIELSGRETFGTAIANSGDYGFGVRVLATGDTTFAKDYTAMFADSADQFSITTETLNPIGQDWYTYNPVTHEPSAKNLVYLVKSGDAQYKVQFATITRYGILTLNIASPNGTTAIPTVVTPEQGYKFTYINLSSQSKVDFAPADSAWDVKFCRTEEDLSAVAGMRYITGRSSIVINSAGGVETAIATGKGIRTVTSISGLEFSSEALAIGHSWYYVDQSEIAKPVYSVPANTFVIKDTEGRYVKFEMNNFFGPEADQQFYSEFVYLAGDAEGNFAE